MKKIFLTIMLLFGILMMCACGNNATVAQNSEDIEVSKVINNVSNNKNLVIYFDYSENIDTAGLTVDAISSASLSNGSTGKNLLNLKDKEIIELKNLIQTYENLKINNKLIDINKINETQKEKKNDFVLNFLSPYFSFGISCSEEN